jgi:DNA-binding transcriptional regulator YhcF (GntR family)
MRAAKPELSASELESLVLDVVTAEAKPLTVTEIRSAMPKALRPASKALTAVVSALADAKRLFRIGRRYSHAPDRSLHERIVRSVSKEARSATELAKELRASTSSVREAIRELIASGELHAYPKQHRVIRYGAHPPSPADLLRPELARLIASAAKLGIDEDQTKRALRELLGATTSNDVILDTIRELEPNGALVYLPHLRTAVGSSYKDKSSFDRAVLTLLTRGAIQLHSHPTPSLLGAAERDAMIEDGRGGYYSAIGLR